MPWELPITIDGEEYPISFENEPSQQDIDYAVAEVQRVHGLPRDTGQGLLSSIGSGAGRGVLSVPKGIVGGAGAALSMIPGMEENRLQTGAREIEDWYKGFLPVNPVLEQTFPVKAGGAAGQGVGFLGTVLATGGLGAGAEVASGVGLGTAGLLGAEQGSEIAREYGVTDPWTRRALITGGGIIEAGTESLGGFGTRNFTRSLLGRMKSAVRPGSAGTRFLKTAGAEGLEEVVAGQLTDWETRALVEEDPMRPGFAKNGAPLPPEAITIKNLKNRLEEFALGGIGGVVFAGAEALGGKTDVSQALAMRLQAQGAIRELRDKTDLTPEQQQELAELQQEDQNLSQWLERQGMDRIRPSVARMVENPQEAAERMAQDAEARGDDGAASYWRSEQGIAVLQDSATEYSALMDNAQLVENDPEATPEERRAAQDALQAHPLNAVNPLQQTHQNRAIDQAWDERLKALGKRAEAAIPPATPDAQAKTEMAPIATEVAQSIQDIDPDLAAAVASIVEDKPQTPQEDATPQVPIQQGLSAQPEGRTEGREAEETSAGDSIQRATVVQEEVTPPTDETSATPQQQAGELPVQREAVAAETPPQAPTPTAEVADASPELPPTEVAPEQAQAVPTPVPAGTAERVGEARVPTPAVAGVRPKRKKRKVVKGLNLSTREAEKAKQRFGHVFGDVRLATVEELTNDPAFKTFWMRGGRTEEDWQTFLSRDLSVAEGLEDDGSGRPVIIPKNVVIYDSDVARAKELGISTGEAAVLRLMFHENWHGVERWLESSSDKTAQELRDRYHGLLGEITEGELDDIAKRRYSEMAAWRDDARTKRLLQSEVMAERREAARLSGKPDSLVERFMAWLRDVWMHITGSKKEPTENELEEIFEAWRRAMQTDTRAPPEGGVQASKPEVTPTNQRLSEIASYFEYAASRTQEEGMDPAKATEDEREFATTGMPVELYRMGTTVAGQQAMAREVIDILAAESPDGRSHDFGKRLLSYMRGNSLPGLPYRPALAVQIANYFDRNAQDRVQLGMDWEDVQKARQTALSQAASGLQAASHGAVYKPLKEIADKAREVTDKALSDAGIDDPKKVSDAINKGVVDQIKESAKTLTPPVLAPIVEAAENDSDNLDLAFQFLGPENAQIYQDLQGWLDEIQELLERRATLTGEGGNVAASKPELPENLTLAQIDAMLADRKKKVEGALQKLKVVMEGGDSVEVAKKVVKKAKKKAAEAKEKEAIDNAPFKAWVMGAESAGVESFNDLMLKYIQPDGFNREAFTALLTNKFKGADPTFIMGVVNRVADLLDGAATEEGIEEDQKKAPNFDARAKRIVAKSLGNKVDEKTIDPLAQLTKRRLKEEITAEAFQDGVKNLGVTEDTAFALSQKVDEDIASRKASKVQKTTKAQLESGEKQAKEEIDKMARALEGVDGKKNAQANEFRKLVDGFKKLTVDENSLAAGFEKLGIRPETAERLTNILIANRQRQILHTWNTIRQNAEKARERAVEKVVKSLKPKKQQAPQTLSKFARMLLDASTNGILDSEAVRQSVAEAWNLHGLTDERLKQLGDLLQKINGMREGMPKETLLIEFNSLLNEVAPTATFVQFAHEALMSYVLGGANTMAMQLTGIGRFINPLSGTVEMLMVGPGTSLEKIGRTMRNLFPVWFASMKEIFQNFVQVRAGMSGLLSSRPYGLGALPSDLSSVKPRQTSMSWTPAGQVSQARFDAPKILQKMGLGEAFRKLVKWPAWMSSRSFQVIRGFEGLVAGADKNIRWRTQMAAALMQANPKLSFRGAWKKVNEALGDKTNKIWETARKQAAEDVKKKLVHPSSQKQREVELVQDALEDRWGSLENRQRKMAALLGYKSDPITVVGSAAYNLVSRGLQSDQRVLKYLRFGFLFARFFTNAIESAWSRTPMGGLTAMMLPKTKPNLDEREQRIVQIFGSLSNYRDDRIARAISGTSTMSFIGMLMVLALQGWDDDGEDPPVFWVTGDPMGEFGKKSIMEAGGWYKPQTLYIGPLRINYVNASPELAMALSAMGNLADRFLYDRLLNYKENPDTGEYEKDQYKSYVKPILESMAAPVSRSTFRSFYDAADSAFNGDFKKMTRLVSNPVVGTAVALSPAAIIPSFKSFEKIERVMDQPRSPRNVAQAFAASIPFTDAGEPLVTPFGEPLSPFPFFSLLSNTQEVSPERGKAARLLGELGIDARGPKSVYKGWDMTEIAFDGDTYLLNDAQRDALLQDVGRRFSESLNREAQSLRMLLKEKEGRQKVRSRITKIAEDARSAALYGFTPTSRK